MTGTISYGYDFRDRVTNSRHRKIVSLARTKWDAEQAEVKAKKELLKKRMRYVRMVKGSKRAAVEAVKLTAGKVGHILATWQKQPPLPAAVNG